MYSKATGFKKALIQAVLFGIPVLLQVLPAEWQNVTLGAALSFVFNWFKYKHIY